MGDVQTVGDRTQEKLRGRDRRTVNLSTKLTAIEARVIEDAATRAGSTPSEWAREALLRAAQGGSSDPITMDIFARVRGKSDADDECIRATPENGWDDDRANQGNLRSGPKDEANPGEGTPRKAREAPSRRGPREPNDIPG